MSYTAAEAERMVKVSALVVGGVYLFRRFTETSAPAAGLPGGPAGPPAPGARAGEQLVPLGTFVLGWGFLYLSLSAVAASWPGFAGNMAVLVMVASLLANGIQVSKDLQRGLKYPGRERRKRGRPNRRSPGGSAAGKLPGNEEGTVL